MARLTRKWFGTRCFQRVIHSRNENSFRTDVSSIRVKFHTMENYDYHLFLELLCINQLNFRSYFILKILEFPFNRSFDRSRLSIFFFFDKITFYVELFNNVIYQRYYWSTDLIIKFKYSSILAIYFVESLSILVLIFSRF